MQMKAFDLSDVESVSDSDKVITPKFKRCESSSDEKEKNIRLWANSANINNNLKSLERTLVKVHKEIRDTDESIVLLSEKVQAKSKLITGVQKKFLEQKKETDDQIKEIFEKLIKIDQNLGNISKHPEADVRNMKSFPNETKISLNNDAKGTNLVVGAVILGSSLILSSYFLSKIFI